MQGFPFVIGRMDFRGKRSGMLPIGTGAALVLHPEFHFRPVEVGLHQFAFAVGGGSQQHKLIETLQRRRIILQIKRLGDSGILLNHHLTVFMRLLAV